ncbi:MAG TPA: hypothetical protein VI636_23455 [Candidatus Angelobacter sp.]
MLCNRGVKATFSSDGIKGNALVAKAAVVLVGSRAPVDFTTPRAALMSWYGPPPAHPGRAPPPSRFGLRHYDAAPVDGWPAQQT